MSNKPHDQYAQGERHPELGIRGVDWDQSEQVNSGVNYECSFCAGSGGVNEVTADALDALMEEVAYLRYFFQEADFGPADGDVRYIMNENYEGKIPEGYEHE